MAAREWLAAREADCCRCGTSTWSSPCPSQIADIAYQNKAAIYDLLFKAAAETMLTIAADPKHLGARIGFIAVLHSWGSAMTHHPHVHMIVPGGGISLDGERWIACRRGFFLPVLVLSKLFRRLLLEKLAAAHKRASWVLWRTCGPAAPMPSPLPGAAEKDQLVRLCQAAFAGPETVLAYLAALHAPRRHLEPPPVRRGRDAASPSPLRTTGSKGPAAIRP